MKSCDCQRCNENVEVLGLDPPVTFEEITIAYRDLAKVWHPDRFENEPRLRKKAEEEFKAIQGAFTTLKEHRSGNPSSDEGQAETAIQRQSRSDYSERRSAREFDLSPADASRIFRSVIDGTRIRVASNLSFADQVLIAQNYFVENMNDLRLVIGSGCVLTNSHILTRGFLNKNRTLYSSFGSWKFRVTAYEPHWSDRLADKLSGKVSDTLTFWAERATTHESFNIGAPVRDHLMPGFLECMHLLQRDVCGSES